MLPVFNEYIQFLKDVTNNDDELNNLSEGFYWLDNQIIKAYDKQGNIHKIYRIKVDNELNVTYKKYNNKQLELESWQDTIKRNKIKLDRIEQHSLKLIADKLEKYKDYNPVVFTSTGKDSELTRYLVNKVSQNFKIIFNNTSMDCADTYKIVKTIPNCIIINPKEGFYNKIKDIGIPTRHHRWCCAVYKEGETRNYLDENNKYLFFYGIRNEESLNRLKYQDEKYDDRWVNRDWIGILPIREWSEEDIWLYTLRENISFNSKYRKGYRRVGCAIVCPYYTKSTWVLDKYWYPTMYNRFQKLLREEFYERQLWCALNCTVSEYPLCWNGGVIRSKPTEEVIKECAEYKGINIDIARKYFNKTCKSCGNKITKNDVIAMNMKFLGRNIEQFMCKKCLRKFLNLTIEQWNKYIKDFKEFGCDLF